MSYRGKVKNGVVVLEPDSNLPEGSTVRVELETGATLSSFGAGEDDPVFRIGELAKPTGIPDLTVNIDHYMDGWPKVSHGR